MHSVSFWMERNQEVHKREWCFMALGPLLAEIKYPVDLFVRFQSRADELGVPDWDPEQYELLVFWVAESRVAYGYDRRDAISLDDAAAPPPTRVLALSIDELKAMLEAMERRHWNDIIYARERGPADRKDGEQAQRPAEDVADLIANMQNMGI